MRITVIWSIPNHILQFGCKIHVGKNHLLLVVWYQQKVIVSVLPQNISIFEVPTLKGSFLTPSLL